MTQVSKITSIIAAILLFVGTFFKTNHWFGANIMLMVGAAAGVLLFILLALNIPAELKEKMGKYSIYVASITLIVAFIAFTFKLLHWPGAAKLIWIADISIMVSAIVVLIDALLEKDHARSILKVMIAFFALFLFLVVVFAR